MQYELVGGRCAAIASMMLRICKVKSISLTESVGSTLNQRLRNFVLFWFVIYFRVLLGKLQKMHLLKNAVLLRYLIGGLLNSLPRFRIGSLLSKSVIKTEHRFVVG